MRKDDTDMRKTALLLALLLCATMITGCRSKNPAKDDTGATGDTIAEAQAAIDGGDVRAAYDLLKADGSDEAKAMLEKFAFVLTKDVRNDGPTTVYTYDAAGNLTAEDYTYIGSAIGDYWSKITYTHDTAGHDLTEEYTDCNGYRESTTHAYDEQGNEIRLTATNGENGAYTLTITYDDNGNALTKRFDYEDGHSSESVYTYDANGNQLSVVMTEGGTYREERVRTYDADGNVLTDVYSNSDIGVIHNEVYTYEQDGNVVICRDLSDPDNDSTTTLTYRDDGSTLTVDHVARNGVWRKAVYTYDASGNILTKNCSTSNDTVEAYVCTYDADGNLLTKNYTVNIGSDHVATYTWELRYYPNGVPEQVSTLAESVYLQDKIPY